MSTNDDAPAALAGFPERLLPMAVPLDTLREDPRNARTHSTRNLDAVRFSLATFGWRGLVIVREDDRTIVAGHARVAAARELGWTHAPVLFVDEARARSIAFAIADNRTAELAEWDDAALAATLRELRDDDAAWLDGLEFNAEELHEIAPDVFEAPRTEEADDVPEAPAPRDVVTRRGDLWLLGDHRVLCGDSTKAEDVARLMGGEKAGMMVTDPPYGVDYDPEMRESVKSVGKIANDDRASWRDAWDLFGGDVAYVWHASLFTSVVLADLEAVGLRRVAMIIWKKPYATLSVANYHWQHETCWYCVRPSGLRKWVGSPKESTVWDMTQPKDPYGLSGEDKTPHPTQKPVEAMARPMRNHNHQLIYDPFLGSGTTLIAAEQLGRRCFGMEISPAYCDVVVRRWENLTGKRARRVTADDAEVF